MLVERPTQSISDSSVATEKKVFTLVKHIQNLLKFALQW